MRTATSQYYATGAYTAGTQPPLFRPFIPMDVSALTCDYWYDAADRTLISATGTTFDTLSNKGGLQGSNLSRLAGTPTTGVVTFNNLNCIGLPDSNTNLSYPGSFRNSVLRTRFFVVRSTAPTASGSVWLLHHDLVSASLPDRISFNSSNATIQEWAGTQVRLAATGDRNPSNVMLLLTARYTSAQATNYVGINGSARALTSTSFGANFATDATTYMNRTQTGGAANTGSFDLAEFISYAAALTTEQTQQVEGYLAWKWGLQSGLPVGHLHKSAPPYFQAITSPLVSSLSPMIIRWWLDARDTSTFTLNGSNVSQWNDKGISGWNVSQTTDSLRPILSNGLVNFNNNRYLNVPLNAMPAGSAFILALVINPISSTNWILGKPYSTASNVTASLMSTSRFQSTTGVNTAGTTNSLYWSANANSNLATTNLIQPSTLQMFTIQTSGGQPDSNAVWINGTRTLYTGTLGIHAGLTITGTSFTLGAWIPNGVIQNSGVTNFQLGELIYSTGNTLARHRFMIEGYLAWKWGLQTSLPISHPYRSTKP